MSKDQVVKVVNDFLVDEFEIDSESLTPDAVLNEALDLDSLDYVDLVISIESNFGFKVTGEDFKTIRTLEDFYNFICSKLATSKVHGQGEQKVI